MGNINTQRPYIHVGEHKTYEHCRFCLQKALRPFISFGNVPLAGGFLTSLEKKTVARERLYPLTLVFCSSCGLVQVKEVVEAKTLFGDYFYRSSAIGTLASHFEVYADRLASIYPTPKATFIVEIGSNDGVFLKPLRKHGFRVLGVDPAVNIVASLSKKDAPTVCACFGEKTAKSIRKKYGLADCIVTSNSFAHINDMHDVMRGVDALLHPQGTLLIETHYLGTLLGEFQYDMMYHEHQSYYSLLALEAFLHQYDMEVFDVYPIPIHGGSMHYEAQRRGLGGRKINKRVEKLRLQEKKQGLDTFSTYRSFAAGMKKQKAELLSLLTKLRLQGKRVVGYGASGRATILMGYCDITSDHIECVVDDAPSKQGSFTPGNHLPIVNSSILRGKNRPDYCLLFAWAFAQEIKKRNTSYLQSGGKFIVPLPSVGVIK